MMLVSNLGFISIMFAHSQKKDARLIKSFDIQLQKCELDAKS